MTRKICNYEKCPYEKLYNTYSNEYENDLNDNCYFCNIDYCDKCIKNYDALIKVHWGCGMKTLICNNSDCYLKMMTLIKDSQKFTSKHYCKNKYYTRNKSNTCYKCNKINPELCLNCNIIKYVYGNPEYVNYYICEKCFNEHVTDKNNKLKDYCPRCNDYLYKLEQ